ncbi:MAG: porin [Pseudomonadales bacterium]|nr:porin [Pseudomonadales bacterium]
MGKIFIGKILLPPPVRCYLVFLMLLILVPPVAFAGDRPQSEILVLKERLSQLEQNQGKLNTGSRDKPSVQVGGYAKLDVVYSSASAGASSIADEFIVNALIPSDNDGESDQLKMTARESRLWVKGATADNTSKFYIEGDFFGDKPSSSETLNNNADFRLRQAYGEIETNEYGRFLLGQAWSTFQNLSAFPHATTLGTLPGQVFTRVSMIRWTSPANHSLQIALENPESNLKDLNNASVRPDDDRIPDIVIRYNLQSVSVASLIRQLRCDMPGTCEDSQSAWAVSVTGRLNPTTRDQLRFQIHLGDGIGRYVSGAVFPGGTINANGDIETVEVQALMLSYQHQWNRRWASAVIFNTASADNLNAIGGASEEVTTFHVNSTWRPTKPLRLGFEFIRAERETVAGTDGDLNRLIFSSKYHF